MNTGIYDLRNGWPQFDSLYYQYAPVIWTVLIGYFLIITYTTYLLFKLDKARAIGGLWRVSETTLLFCAFVGGSLGAKIAQRRFRHKTRKEPFRSNLNFIIVIQFFFACYAIAWGTGFAPSPKTLFERLN